jgi:hypothetical protein
MDCVPPASCWGAQLVGKEPGATPCAHGFVIGKRHFKSKFCSAHRQEMWLPADRLRVLPEALVDKVANNRSGGVWNVMHLPMGTGEARYRVINNTDGCYLPRLIVFDQPPPSHLPWEPLPSGYVVDDDGYLQLSVARGTVVPTLTEGAGKNHERYQRAVPSSSPAKASPSPPSSPSPPPSPISEPVALEEALNQALDPRGVSTSLKDPPTLTKVLVPSVLMKLSGAAPACEPLPALCTDSDSPRSTEMTEEEKTQKRMMNNRKSAAVSRERKRKYIEELEQQVGQLEGQVVALYEENRLWQSLELSSFDYGDFFDAVCKIDL